MSRPLSLTPVEFSVLVALCDAISGRAKPSGTPDDEALSFALHDVIVTEDGPTPARCDPRPRALALLPWLLAAYGFEPDPKIDGAPEIATARDAILSDDWPDDAPDGFDWLMVCAGLAEWDEGPGHTSVPAWRAGVLEALLAAAGQEDDSP